MANEQFFYVGPNKKPVGPYTLSQLQDLASQGVIKPTTKAIRKGDRRWVPYSQLATVSPVSPTPAAGKGTHVEGVGYVPKGQFTPEMLARLNREKAESGEIEIALMWNTSDDLDLYCVEPGGFCIDFRTKESPTGGWLDVDMNVSEGGENFSLEPVEHIRWKQGKAPKGEYKVGVKLYTYRTDKSVPFTVAIKVGNEVMQFNLEFVLESVQESSFFGLSSTVRNVMHTDDIPVHTFQIGP